MKKISYLNTPLGSVELITEDEFIIFLQFCQNTNMSLAACRLHYQVFEQLADYFSNKLFQFNLPIKTFGTDFQKRAWNILQEIPYGQTISYRDQAFNMGLKCGFQAVGQANKKNPIQIIIPCHRVIHQNGNIGAYAGMENSKKIFLLNHEQSKKTFDGGI